VGIWYIFSRFGILYQEKSGNPEPLPFFSFFNSIFIIALTRRPSQACFQARWPRRQGCQMVYFQTKNRKLGKFFEGLAMEDVGTFYAHLVYFTYIRPFSIFNGHLVYFSRFGMLHQDNLATLLGGRKTTN
jgi:hypothetical protein